MKPIYSIKACAEIQANKRKIFTDISDNVPARTMNEAETIFTDSWSAPNIKISHIKGTVTGNAYDVMRQPAGYSAFGYKFKDNDIYQIRVYPNEKCFNFMTKTPNEGLSIGLNWTDEEFQEILDKLTNELSLK